MKIDYAKKFIEKDRKFLNWKNNIQYIEKNSVRIETPEMLAAFTGYLKFQHINIGDIYFRGEKNYYETTIPSIFRTKNINEDIIKNRINALIELNKSLPEIFKGYRFKNDNFNSLLQHYGIKTEWIDLVDNLYIALWFATFNNKSKNCYIKILCQKYNDNSLIISNLRKEHSSLSLRPHCQHGVSATKKVEEWNLSNIDFNDFVVSKIEIPNDFKFEMQGTIFKKEYMFPNKSIDNTLKELSRKKFRVKLLEITKKYNLQINSLGIIN